MKRSRQSLLTSFLDGREELDSVAPSLSTSRQSVKKARNAGSSHRLLTNCNEWDTLFGLQSQPDVSPAASTVTDYTRRLSEQARVELVGDKHKSCKYRVEAAASKVQKSSANKHTEQTRRRKKSEQLFLDFGQRDFDATVCSVCGMVYAKGKEADEAAHKKFHRKHTSAITFPPSVHQYVVKRKDDGEMIVHIPAKVKNVHIRRKCQDIRSLIDIQLGVTDSINLSYELFVYLDNRRSMIGGVVVELIRDALSTPQRMAVPLQKSAMGVIQCADQRPCSVSWCVHRIYVCPSSRRKRIATRLLESVLSKVSGEDFSSKRDRLALLQRHPVAFGELTQDGLALAEDFTDNQVLIELRDEEQRGLS